MLCSLVDEHTERVRLVLKKAKSMSQLYIFAILNGDEWEVSEATLPYIFGFRQALDKNTVFLILKSSNSNLYIVDGLKVKTSLAVNLGYTLCNKSVKYVEFENLSSHLTEEYPDLEIDVIKV